MFIEPQQKNIWDRCLNELKGQIPDGAFYTWFPNLEFHEMDDSQFVIGTPNNFVLDYVSHHYKDTIQRVLDKVSGLSLMVKFTNLDKSCTPSYPG